MVAALAVVVAVGTVTLSLTPRVATHTLPREVERAVASRELGRLDPPPPLVQALSRQIGASESAVRGQMLTQNLELDDHLIRLLGSPDDRVALSACAWICAGGVAPNLAERAFRAEGFGAESERRRALAVVAASCTGPTSATLAREALAQGGNVALGGAYALWRLGTPLSEAEASVLPKELAAALATGQAKTALPDDNAPPSRNAP